MRTEIDVSEHLLSIGVRRTKHVVKLSHIDIPPCQSLERQPVRFEERWGHTQDSEIDQVTVSSPCHEIARYRVDYLFGRTAAIQAESDISVGSLNSQSGA